MQIILDILWNIAPIFRENCFAPVLMHHILVTLSITRTACLGVQSSSCDRPESLTLDAKGFERFYFRTEVMSENLTSEFFVVRIFYRPKFFLQYFKK